MLSIGGITIHRYGLFYVMTFGVGYVFLDWIKNHPHIVRLPHLHTILRVYLDDIVMRTILWVIIGGRLGHVLIYDPSYYGQHPWEILQIRKGGMSFVGGFVGVALTTRYLYRRFQLNRKEIMMMYDLIVLVLPLGIALGRLGNFLNEELVGLPLSQLALHPSTIVRLSDSPLSHIYHSIDHQVRINTNLIEWLCEGVVLWIIGRSVWRYYKDKEGYPSGLITGIFMVGYGVMRGLLEQLRDNPSTEYIRWYNKSLLRMIVFVLVGCAVILQSRHRGEIKKSD